MERISKRNHDIILGLVVLISVFGCAGSSASKLVGTWQEVGKTKNVIEFLRNGSFKGHDPQKNSETIWGKWLPLKNGEISLEIGTTKTSESVKGKVGFEGEELILTLDGLKPFRFKKVK